MAEGNKATIAKLYEALDKGDMATLKNLYHPDATFEDPAFKLTGRKEILGMWGLATDRPADNRMAVSFSNVTLTSANWVARYKFSESNSPVINKIASQFEFDRDGKIIKQRDRFDLKEWASQALGIKGMVIGTVDRIFGTHFLDKAIQGKARAKLEAHMQVHPE